MSACSTDVGDLGAISETTGAGGGTPDLPGGVALTVPAGALSGDVAIGSGCYQDAQAGHCTDNGRPLLPAGSDTDQATHDACADVAVYGCAP